MKKQIVLSFLALIMLNCKNKKQNTENLESASSQEVATEANTSLDLGCYVFNDGKNTVSFEITESRKKIQGQLIYNLSEKDKNSGSFIGQFKDGILIGIYTFQSEGTTSTREVAFKVDKNALIEGYGEMTNEGTAFKDVSNLNFSSKMPLTKTDCDKLKKVCLYENGKAYSQLKQSCLELAALKIKLNPLKNGAKIEGNSAYLLFNSDNSKAEIFLPQYNKGIVLEKSKQGNWFFENYILISWKGYVLSEKGVAIYGGS